MKAEFFCFVLEDVFSSTLFLCLNPSQNKWVDVTPIITARV